MALDDESARLAPTNPIGGASKTNRRRRFPGSLGVPSSGLSFGGRPPAERRAYARTIRL